MDEFDEDAMFEVATVDAVRVPVAITPTPPPSLQCPPDVRYIYTEKNGSQVRIYYANDCKPNQRARNEQLEWAHTHEMGGFTRVKWTGRSDVRIVRILASDVIHSMLKSVHRGLLTPANGKIDIMTVKAVLARRYPPKERTGPTSPLDYIVYDAKRGIFVWGKALTPYMWHLQVGDAAFANIHRGIRALRTNRVDGGDESKKSTTRVEALRLFGEYGSLGALLAAVKVAQGKPPAKAVVAKNPRLATPPPPPSSPAVVASTQPRRPTTGGKGLVTHTGETPKLTASAAFDNTSESDSDSDSDVADSASPPEEGRDAEDAFEMDSSDSDGEESEGTADDVALLYMRAPIEDSEPVLGIKRAADDLCHAYMRKIFEEGRHGPSPEVSRDEDHRLLARGLQAQVDAQLESIHLTELQISSYERALEILKRKREDDRTILGELVIQLRAAKRRCDLPTDDYVLTRAKELKRIRRLAGKSQAWKPRPALDVSQSAKSVDIL